MAAAQKVATAMTPALPPGYGVAFVLIHVDTGNLVASSLPAASPAEIATVFEQVLRTLRAGPPSREVIEGFDRRTGAALFSVDVNDEKGPKH